MIRKIIYLSEDVNDKLLELSEKENISETVIIEVALMKQFGLDIPIIKKLLELAKEWPKAK